MQHSLRTPHAPEYKWLIREILEAEGRFLEETLDYIEREDARRGGIWAGWDMGDLIAHAADVDSHNRHQRADERRQKARRRLCRIIAKQYTRAVSDGDIDECERLADALAKATRDWCNG